MIKVTDDTGTFLPLLNSVLHKSLLLVQVSTRARILSLCRRPVYCSWIKLPRAKDSTVVSSTAREEYANLEGFETLAYYCLQGNNALYDGLARKRMRAYDPGFIADKMMPAYRERSRSLSAAWDRWQGTIHPSSEITRSPAEIEGANYHVNRCLLRELSKDRDSDGWKAKLQAKSSLVGMSFSDEKALRVDDLRKSPFGHEHPDASAEAKRYRFRSALTAPVVHHGHKVGVLQVTATEPGCFSVDDLKRILFMGQALGHILFVAWRKGIIPLHFKSFPLRDNLRVGLVEPIRADGR